jgi:hypothetical protein
VRVLLTATMAASVLAIGLNMQPAQSLPPGGAGAGPDAATAVLKAQQRGTSPGPGGAGQRATTPGPRAGGGAGGGRVGSQGPQMRQGQRGARGFGPRMGEARGVRRGEIRGFRGGRRFGPRVWRGGRVYGFTSGCGWLRRRALDTGSRFWWRRYRDCLR